ncbi:MAG TPA: L-serine ammonia-lyase, iron-sulfur-dependent subunit beta [Longimicrobium sp.]|jgi:L-serine dehydratase|uniref:L-serine ammonia-lyase, iron-sulfur-dependent subunit beta n=1 Tax=Longimicrobium sp. TaxID=2029185 RepID=UPI002EDA0E22
MVSLFDILGPTMVGPSSSHTAGACRLGLIARAVAGGTPDRVRIQLHGSFAATGEGHGTHRAIVGGLVGLPPDDLRLREGYEEARAAGLQWEFEEVDLGDDAHPNTAIFHIERGEDRLVVRGASLGGGRVEVSEIDGFPVALGGAYHTLVLLAHDEPGTIAAVATILSAHHVNLATMRVDRTGRHQDALMTIEADEPVSDAALGAIRSFPWLRWARAVPRIA